VSVILQLKFPGIRLKLRSDTQPWGPSMDAQDIYLDLYGEFGPFAEYLQADSRVRNLLPEAMIVAGLGFALSAFAESFLKEVGGAAGKAVVEKVKGLFGKTAEAGDRAALIEGLAVLEPYLNALKAASSAEADARRAVASMLEKKGFPADTAADAAGQIVETLRRGGEKAAL
jgi:hypothetical protein